MMIWLVIDVGKDGVVDHRCVAIAAYECKHQAEEEARQLTLHEGRRFIVQGIEFVLEEEI